MHEIKIESLYKKNNLQVNSLKVDIILQVLKSLQQELAESLNRTEYQQIH